MLVDKIIKVKWNPNTKRYYESLLDNNGIQKYHYTKKGYEFEILIDELPLKSEVKVRFVCDYCNGKNQIEQKDKTKMYKDLIRYRNRTGTNKDCCNHKECKKAKTKEANMLKGIEKGKSLAEKFPNLIKEWSERNQKTPYDYYSKSHDVVWWICEKGHEYDMPINNKTNSKANCPYCANKRVNEENSLYTNNPNIAKEWHPNKNGELTPMEITSYSNRPIWWQCEIGHEWQNTPGSRVYFNLGCPYCSNQKVCLDNCLATTHIDLLYEWDFQKNTHISPYEVTFGTSKKAWWICEEGHDSYYSSIASRTTQFTGCPLCMESKGEKKIREFLIKNNIKYEHQYSFEDLRGRYKELRFDFAIFDLDNKLTYLIEYDGEFHFRNVYSEENYKKTKEYDEKKNKYCKSKRIKLIRIPYWEYNEIENILKESLSILSFQF